MVKKLLKISLILLVIGFIFYVTVNVYIQKTSKAYMYASIDKVPVKYTGIVLGAHVGNDGTPSTVLSERLDAGLELYRHGKIKRFLLSGDHGRVKYDEVNNMKLYLTGRGVPECDIFLDHAGFDTYNSMVRAQKIFLVKDAIIITQEFHLSRAIFIARKKGLNVCGFIAPIPHQLPVKYLKFRESIASLKAFGEILIHRNPKFFGPKIPITGDSKLSYD